MSVKVRLLELLEGHDGYISGEEISKRLSVSRNAVWKAVTSLRSEGFIVSAATNRGYRLERGGDNLSGAGIRRYLTNGEVFQVEVHKRVTSTSTLLRDAAAKGAPEGILIAAEEQTAGKGRLGRSFYSPPKGGAYFSLLLRPRLSAGEATLITSAAAVAAARAIETVTGAKTGIKWVNDLFYKDKKVCGILTEATFDMESGLIESAVLGIGINIVMPEGGYPGELADIVASVSSGETGEGVRNRVIAETVNNFWPYYKNLSTREFLNEYRARSIILGQNITVLSGDGEREACALDIDENCGLVVRFADGEIKTLSSGEVSIRRRETDLAL